MRTKKIAPNAFALLLVLILMAIAVVVGTTYMNSATLKEISSGNLAKVARAKYLAESGVHHGCYMLMNGSTALTNSTSASQLGPYYADSTSDYYTVYCVPGSSGAYTLYADANVSGIHQHSSLTVQVSSGKMAALCGAVILPGTSSISTPATLTIHGDVYCNGVLGNSAYIDGNVNCAKNVTNWGTITGTINQNTGVTTAEPNLTTSQYRSTYILGGSTCTTATQAGNLSSSSSLCNGGAMTSTNPAGVVYLTIPRGSTSVQLGNNVNFKGTLVVDGDLDLNGSNINITPADGMPAIVVTGQVHITSTTSATVNGLVVADNGIGLAPYAYYSWGTSLTINGGLCGQNVRFDYGLSGRQTINQDANRAQVYDVTNSGGGQRTMTLTTWGD